MALAICSLITSLGPANQLDYVYASYFLICTATFLKIRWWVLACAAMCCGCALPSPPPPKWYVCVL